MLMMQTKLSVPISQLKNVLKRIYYFFDCSVNANIMMDGCITCIYTDP